MLTKREITLPQLILSSDHVLALCKQNTRRQTTTVSTIEQGNYSNSPVIKAERTFWASAKVIPAQSPE
jgi:hypothetical protein